jgi:ABC-type glycerol-3-phosphate transport system substrate-binding protein
MVDYPNPTPYHPAMILPEIKSTMFSVTATTRFLTVLILALLMAGCSSTKLAESWEAPDVNEPPASKVLLVALTKDPVTRRFFEKHFVAEAKKQGVEVIPSSEYAPHATDHDEKQEIIELVKKVGAEGVLVAQIKGVQKEYGYVPSRLDWYPDAWGSVFFYDYYYQSYRAVYRPGYVGSDNYFHMQLRYFSTRSEKMLWAANTVTKNPRSVVGTIEQIADEVIDDLRGASLVKGGGLF